MDTSFDVRSEQAFNTCDLAYMNVLDFSVYHPDVVSSNPHEKNSRARDVMKKKISRQIILKNTESFILTNIIQDDI